MSVLVDFLLQSDIDIQNVKYKHHVRTLAHALIGDLRTGSKKNDIVKYWQTKAKSLPNDVSRNDHKIFLKKSHFYGAHTQFCVT